MSITCSTSVAGNEQKILVAAWLIKDVLLGNQRRRALERVEV